MFEVQFMVIVPHHLLFETFSSAQQFECQLMFIAVPQNSFPLILIICVFKLQIKFI